MKYFLDTEFVEGTQRTLFGKTKPTIDLISIGIVCEDNRQYYAISKDFNIKEAWNRFQIDVNESGAPYKNYWLRNNVLRPIFDQLCKQATDDYNGIVDPYLELDLKFTYRRFKRLVKKYGKTNADIADDILHFTRSVGIDYPKECQCTEHTTCYQCEATTEYNKHLDTNIQFYGYYSDYDWVVFCWLFGRMIDLPNGFPMYCIDLKQMFDEKQAIYSNNYNGQSWLPFREHTDYPKQTNKHNALDDAFWNYNLYNFLNKF